MVGAQRPMCLVGNRAGASRGSLAILWLLAAVLAIVLILPAIAAASLPDNRVYEQVSPPDKDGNFILPGQPFGEDSLGEIHALLGSATGDAVMFATSGAVGKTNDQGGLQEEIARRTPGVGWMTTPADPRELGETGLVYAPEWPSFYPNRDFSTVFFDSHSLSAFYEGAWSSEEPGSGWDLKLYRSDNPFEEPEWVGKPSAAKPIPALGGPTGCNCAKWPGGTAEWVPSGVNPEGSTIDFIYSGTLLPEDEEPLIEIVNEKHEKEVVPGPNSRAGHVDGGLGGGEDSWGFYEYHDGVLSEAGTLPDGKLSPYGAVAAGDAETGPGLWEWESEGFAEASRNQLSENGNRAFFVSPEPGTGGEWATSEEWPQVYVRETLASGEHKSVLVSRSELCPTGGEPVGAPDGESTFAYASPDGSHVFFESHDALNSEVPAPNSEFAESIGSNATGGTFTLTVTAGCTTQTTAPLAFGASMAQVQTALEGLGNVGSGKVEVSGSPPFEYHITFPKLQASVRIEVENIVVPPKEEPSRSITDLTSPMMYDFDVETGQLRYVPEMSGGQILTLSQNGSRVLYNSQVGHLDLWSENGNVETISQEPGATPARASTDGNDFLYSTITNYYAGQWTQFYHYEVSTKELVCVSCSPEGEPSAPVETNYGGHLRTILPVQIMSADGSRIFFQSSAPLVSAAVNGTTNVYEWENGHVYLISSGTSPLPSLVIDSSETGGDVFFLTDEGLVPSDEDEQVDVYDARIPRPGDNPPPAQTPCSGDVCQGPPSVPQLLTPAASASFEGLGNIPPEVEAPPPKTAVKTLTSAQKLAKALKACKKKSKKQRAKCEKQARKAYKAARVKKSDRKAA